MVPRTTPVRLTRSGGIGLPKERLRHVVGETTTAEERSECQVHHAKQQHERGERCPDRQGARVETGRGAREDGREESADRPLSTPGAPLFQVGGGGERARAQGPGAALPPLCRLSSPPVPPLYGPGQCAKVAPHPKRKQTALHETTQVGSCRGDGVVEQPIRRDRLLAGPARWPGAPNNSLFAHCGRAKSLLAALTGH